MYSMLPVHAKFTTSSPVRVTYCAPGIRGVSDVLQFSWICCACVVNKSMVEKWKRYLLAYMCSYLYLFFFSVSLAFIFSSLQNAMVF